MAKPFRFSPSVAEKLLQKHNIVPKEVMECFLNREGPTFTDIRLNPQTDPPTMWFVAATDRGRSLKVVYMEFEDAFVIKTAYEPRDGSDVLYRKLCDRPGAR